MEAGLNPDVGTPILEAPVAEGARDQHMVLNMGPQHPATHGVLRLVLEIDGEIVVRVYPEIGYLHTGIEKTCEAKFYQQVVPLTDRVDYLGPMANNLCYCAGGGEAAGAADSGQGAVDAGAAGGADAAELAPDLAGHARHGYWRADGVSVHLPRARGSAADL